ncbi:metal-sensitive transcriptional regulator [Rhizobium laguerreae]|nr:hypothetical protein [Rhizobium laguerreae]
MRTYTRPGSQDAMIEAAKPRLDIAQQLSAAEKAIINASAR